MSHRKVTNREDPGCFRLRGVLCFDEKCYWRDRCKPATSLEEFKRGKH